MNESNLTIEDARPSLSVDSTQAVFQDSTVTYNQTGITYNEIGVLYAGSDRIVDKGPTMGDITNL
jgi:hypothetical protein